MQTFIVNILCKDQTGLVATVTACLFDLGLNLATTHFALLGEGAKLTAICETTDSITCEEIQQSLSALDNLINADIKVSIYTLNNKKANNTNVSHHIVISGGDHPGLIARVSEVFIEYNGNIVTLNAEKIMAQPDNLYHIEIDAFIPNDRQDACLATLSNTASSLGMQFQVS